MWTTPVRVKAAVPVPAGSAYRTTAPTTATSYCITTSRSARPPTRSRGTLRCFHRCSWGFPAARTIQRNDQPKLRNPLCGPTCSKEAPAPQIRDFERLPPPELSRRRLNDARHWPAITGGSRVARLNARIDPLPRLTCATCLTPSLHLSHRPATSTCGSRALLAAASSSSDCCYSSDDARPRNSSPITS
jgi:hypothetical protein